MEFEISNMDGREFLQEVDLGLFDQHPGNGDAPSVVDH